MLTTGADKPADRILAPTELGRLTARLMVSPTLCDSLRQALARAPVPAGPQHAEDVLAMTLGGAAAQAGSGNRG
jgi:helicase